MPSMEVHTACIQQGHHTHKQTFFQTTYNDPPKGGGSIISVTKTKVIVFACISVN